MKLFKEEKQVMRIYNVVEYDDGHLQILIMGQDGQVFAKTGEFPAHELAGHINIFFNTGLEESETEDTNPLYVIQGGK